MTLPSSELARQPKLKSKVSFKQAATSLEYPNYRKWFIGQLASLTGTWMQSTAQGFLVYQLTGSPAYLGLVAFAAGAPAWVFTLFGGVISDRMPRRTLLVITQTTMMLLAFILAWIVYIGFVQAWHVVVLAFLLGVANAFDAPARMAFVTELVDRPALSNAIALNSTMVTLATIVGPAVAGLAYAAFGAAWCFTINAVSFLAVIVALLLMKMPKFIKPEQKTSALQNLREGFSYTRQHASIGVLLIMVAFTALIGIGFMALLPAWAVQVLKGDSATNGYLQSARGVGSLIAAFSIASLGNIRIKGRILTIGSFLLPLMLIGWSFVTNVPISLLFMVGIGTGFMLLTTMGNTLVQTLVEDRMRGRVSALYTLSFFGMMPIGSLSIGLLANTLGEPRAILISGIISLCVAVGMWWKAPHIRALE